MKKLVFFDIDGTLLPDGEKEIRKEVIEDINKIKEEAEVFICTGRGYGQAKRYIDALGIENYITSNGQEVCYQGEIIYCSYFPTQEKNDVVKDINNRLNNEDGLLLKSERKKFTEILKLISDKDSNNSPLTHEQEHSKQK